MYAKLLVAIFLIMGITNPIKTNNTDIVISSLVFVLASLCAISFFKQKLFPAQLLLKKTAMWILITLFIVDAVLISSELRKFLTHENPYNNDPGVLLSTYRSMEKGIDYYDSYQAAQLGRFAQSIIPGDIWGWRLPTIFYIWKFLPGESGLSIYFLYLLAASVTLFISYDLTKRFLGPFLAFLSPYLLFPYLHFAARDQMLLETEWWAVFLFIASIYFLLKKKLFLATIFFSLTVLVRELFVLPVGLMFLYCIFKQRKLAPVFLIPSLAFLVLFTYHIWRVNDYIDATGTLLNARTVPNGFFFLQQTFAFVSWEYLLFKIRPFIILTTLATLGCLILIRRKYFEGTILLLSFLPFPLAFLRFGTVPYNDYWGIVYVPMAIILSPLGLLVLKQARIFSQQRKS